MNIVALGVFVIVFALIWKKERTTLRFLLGSLAGTIGFNRGYVGSQLCLRCSFVR